PQTALVPAGQTAVFSAGGQDADGNPAPLDALNWSSTIGQIVRMNGTLATFRAPTQPGTGVVSAREGNISGSANVTVDPSALPGAPPPSPWGGSLWTGLLLIAGGLAGGGIAWQRRSANRACRTDDLMQIARAGLLVVRYTARRRRDRRGDWKRAASREAEQPPFEDRGRRESGIDFVIAPEEPLRRA